MDTDDDVAQDGDESEYSPTEDGSEDESDEETEESSGREEIESDQNDGTMSKFQLSFSVTINDCLYPHLHVYIKYV